MGERPLTDRQCEVLSKLAAEWDLVWHPISGRFDMCSGDPEFAKFRPLSVTIYALMDRKLIRKSGHGWQGTEAGWAALERAQEKGEG